MIRKSMVISIIFSILLTSNIHGLFILNETDCVFVNCGKGEDSRTTPIKFYIIKGAEHFLKSYSSMLLFLNRIESSELKGIDYIELQEILNTAIVDLQVAKVAYFDLKNAASNILYNQEIISKLNKFDYAAYKGKYILCGPIFEKVKSFLEKGDIIGIYNDVFVNVSELLERLESLKRAIDSMTFPDISELWRINQKYSEINFTGQYTTEVLHNI
ncbi:MAG: hypothetical protein GTO45_03580 [Candidatus Aminicenantes bacterium]|nr:hypothetical protein [Candidatus Aminicenantes bacterium]NIM77807.1 hypothetical protein [Candidatus Aminicenantes bacterium]NIN17120.1 hypothetical protein [Candidatus Aminicenantes bacterium]NIN41013.1 hypothetical protein [Candidatus Aminicenantes bacterium]NIN83818.1 hypothetical protein [Candidatus Aminicenantes bacterium]